MCLCVFGCFGMDLRGFIFFIFPSLCSKENPLSFYKPSVPHGLTAQTYLNGKRCIFDCSLIPKTTVFINVYGTVWKKKVLITWVSIDFPWIRNAATAVYTCINWIFFNFSSSFSFLCTSLYLWLLVTGLKMKSDGEAYFKGHHGSSRHLLDLAERYCLCASRLWAKWFLLAGVKLMAGRSAHLVQLGSKEYFSLFPLCLTSKVPWKFILLSSVYVS